MNGLRALHELAGHWKGQNQVLLPGEAPNESVSTASVTPIVAGKFVQIAYTWAYAASAMRTGTHWPMGADTSPSTG